MRRFREFEDFQSNNLKNDTKKEISIFLNMIKNMGKFENELKSSNSTVRRRIYLKISSIQISFSRTEKTALKTN